MAKPQKDNFYKHQHAQSESNNPAVVPLSSRFTRLDGSGGVNHQREGVQRAVGNMQAPYKKPIRRKQDNPDILLCQEDDCKAYPMKSLEYCTGHARSKGLIENWKKTGREAV
jgi:hypothetical protein